MLFHIQLIKLQKKEQKVENLADGASHDDIVPMINPK